MNLRDICFLLYIDKIDSIVITCVVNYFCLILMIWYFFPYIFFIHYFNIDINTWICICLFFQSNPCIKCTIILNVDMRKVWIFYNIITAWCIQIISLATVDVWVKMSTYHLLRNVQNITSLFPSWQRKRHNYLFYFFKILPQYNWNQTWKWRRISMSWAPSVN